jgi:hemolysin activation/secretion protein
MKSTRLITTTSTPFGNLFHPALQVANLHSRFGNRTQIKLGDMGRYRTQLARVLAVVAGSALTLSTAHAQSRGAGDPLQRLPQVEPPAAPKVSINVAPARTTGMETLLAATLTPKTIKIEGVKSIPFDDVAKRFSGFVGKQITVSMLLDAASDITKLYQERGYALSFAFIPAQDFADGVVRVVAVEGYVSSVTIDGNAGNAEGKIRAFAQHIVDERPLRRATFERYIALLGQLPGIKVAANVAPPQNTDGATELKLAVTRRKIGASTGLGFNQPGIQGLFNVTENGLLSLGEQLSVSALEPRGRDNQSYYAASYSQPIGSDGLTLKADVSRYRGDPEQTGGLPSTVKRSVEQDKVGLTVSYPVILSNTQSLTVSGSAYGVRDEDRYTNQDTGATLGLRSQARVLQTQVDWAQASNQQTRHATVVIAKGVNVLGASKDGFTNIPDESVTNPIDLNFTRVGGTVSQTNQLPLGLATSVSATGQYSAQSLPTSEQITFGAQRYALAYEPGEAAGDSGWAAAVELNRAFSVNTTYLKALVPYISYAIARTYLSKSSAAPVRLASLSVGLRISDSRFYSLDLSVGKAVGDAPIESSSRNPRINATFSYQLD